MESGSRPGTLARHKDTLREFRRQIVLDPKRRLHTTVRLGVGVSERRPPPLLDSRGNSIGNLASDLFLVLLQRLAEVGINDQSLSHSAAPFPVNVEYLTFSVLIAVSSMM